MGVYRVETRHRPQENLTQFSSKFQDKTIEALLTHNASPYIRNNEGRTPLAEMILELSRKMKQQQAGKSVFVEQEGPNRVLRAFWMYAPDLFLLPVEDDKLLPELKAPKVLGKFENWLLDAIDIYVYLIQVSQSLTRLRAAIV